MALNLAASASFVLCEDDSTNRCFYKTTSNSEAAHPEGLQILTDT
jgi:hypothetical protein